MYHNLEITITEANAEPVFNPELGPGGRVCILLMDGRMFGPFKSREDAVYWAVAQELDSYSTYDLLTP